MRLSPSDPLAARATSAAKPPRRPRVAIVEQLEAEGFFTPAPPLPPSSAPLAFVLPYPPVVNKLYGHRVIFVKGKPTAVPYKTHAHREYFDAVTNALCGQAGFQPFPAGELLVVVLRTFRPRRIGDVDGPIKTCLDALSGVAWADDSQIVDLRIIRGDDKHRPRVEVSVSAAAGVATQPSLFEVPPTTGV